MQEKLVVTALWDGEARVWVATSEDVPGLVTEAKDLDALLERVVAVAPELLADNRPRGRSDDSPLIDLHVVSPLPLTGTR